jgi:hypothetical protein
MLKIFEQNQNLKPKSVRAASRFVRRTRSNKLETGFSAKRDRRELYFIERRHEFCTRIRRRTIFSTDWNANQFQRIFPNYA